MGQLEKLQCYKINEEEDAAGYNEQSAQYDEVREELF